MARSSSKRSTKVATRGRRRTPGRTIPAEPIDIRGQPPGGNVRALAPSSDRSAGSPAPQGAAGPQTYLRWADFVAGPQNPDFGFGAYFVEEPSPATGAQSGSSIECTWTPAQGG